MISKEAQVNIEVKVSAEEAAKSVDRFRTKLEEADRAMQRVNGRTVMAPNPANYSTAYAASPMGSMGDPKYANGYPSVALPPPPVPPLPPRGSVPNASFNAKQAINSASAGNAEGFASAIPQLAALAGPIGIAIAAVGAMGAAMDKASKAAEVMADRHALGSEKSRALFEEFIPGTEKLFRFYDALSGVTAAMRQEADRHFIAMGSIRATQERDLAKDEGQRQGVYARNAAIGANATPLSPMAVFDRNTALGQRRADEEAIRQEARDNVVRAQRASTAAQLNESSMRERANDSMRALTQAQNKAETRRRDLGQTTSYARQSGGISDTSGAGLAWTALHAMTGGIGIGIDRYGGGANPFRAGEDRRNTEAARGRASEATGIAMSAEQRAQRDIAAANESAVTSERERNNLAQARLGILRGEIQILQQREGMMSNRSIAFGRMNNGRQNASVRAYEAVVRRDGNVGESMLALAEQFDPTGVARILERRGERRMRELAPRASDDTRDLFSGPTLRESRAAVDASRVDLRSAADRTAIDSADRMAQIVTTNFERLLQAYERRLSLELSRLITERTAAMR